MNHFRSVVDAWVPLSILLMALVCFVYYVVHLIRARIRRVNVITAEELNRDRVTVLIPTERAHWGVEPLQPWPRK
jgi:hypothetical protein